MFTEVDHERVDRSLLRNSAVSLFHDACILSKTCDELRALDYEVSELFCKQGRFQSQISKILQIDWTGNLDTLLDGFSYYPFPASGKAALVFRDYQKLVSESPQLAWDTLNLVEYAARDLLLEGKLLIAMVHTTDPRYECKGIGARSAMWNSHEWTLANRGLA